MPEYPHHQATIKRMETRLAAAKAAVISGEENAPPRLLCQRARFFANLKD